MVNSRSPFLMSPPSTKCTLSSSPEICDFTCTVDDGSTVPMPRISTGTVCCPATATLTGTGGGPPADCTLGAEPQPASSSAAIAGDITLANNLGCMSVQVYSRRETVVPSTVPDARMTCFDSTGCTG